MENEFEKRRRPRIVMCWPAVLKTPQGPIRGITEDISMGGVLSLWSEPIETEDEFEISVRFSKDREMSATVKKIWSEEVLADDSIYYEVGFHFTKISAHNQKIIASLVKKYF